MKNIYPPFFSFPYGPCITNNVGSGNTLYIQIPVFLATNNVLKTWFLDAQSFHVTDTSTLKSFCHL
jgi:hypothetical protein